eukprot:653306_1
MAPSPSCSTNSFNPFMGTIVVGSLMFLCLISTSAHSYTLLRQQAGWNNKSFGSKMKCWAKDIWGRKACYLPLISHLAPLTLPLWQSFTFLLATTHQNSVDWIFGIYSVYFFDTTQVQ